MLVKFGDQLLSHPGWLCSERYNKSQLVNFYFSLGTEPRSYSVEVLPWSLCKRVPTGPWAPPDPLEHTEDPVGELRPDGKPGDNIHI